jgi:hypothetical protein
MDGVVGGHGECGREGGHPGQGEGGGGRGCNLSVCVWGSPRLHLDVTTWETPRCRQRGYGGGGSVAAGCSLAAVPDCGKVAARGKGGRRLRIRRNGDHGKGAELESAEGSPRAPLTPYHVSVSSPDQGWCGLSREGFERLAALYI